MVGMGLGWEWDWDGNGTGMGMGLRFLKMGLSGTEFLGMIEVFK
jgi:hypothetical protein